MSVIIKSITCGLCLFILFSTGMALPAPAADDATNQDLASMILNTIISEGADQGIVDQVHHDDEFANEFSGFLNRDFKTNAFSQHSEITCADIIFTIDGVKNHMGFAVVSFSSSRDLNRAFKAAKSVGRSNFKIMVLTIFRVFRLNQHFIVIYSETPRNQHTLTIFNRLAGYFRTIGGR